MTQKTFKCIHKLQRDTFKIGCYCIEFVEIIPTTLFRVLSSKRTSASLRMRRKRQARDGIPGSVSPWLASPPLPHRAIEKSGKLSLTYKLAVPAGPR